MHQTIKQTGMITKQGEQYLIVIQKANWPKIAKLLGRKLDQEIVLDIAEMKIEA